MFENFYGLAGKPFQLTPDPAFYFRSLTHRKALSYLGYGLAQGEGFVVITGEVGAGKSTLVAHLMGSVDPGQLTVAQIVTSRLDEEEIVHVVAQSFGLDIDGHDKASALGAIEGFLHAEARAGHRCLLIVDESQNLSVAALEELRMLSNFQLGSHPLLQTLLLGQPEFRATLQAHPSLEQLRQRVIAAHHLEPMERSEIEPYILHRLDKVGWTGNPQFDPQVFADLYDASGGVPRRVNQIANRLLLLGAVERSSRIDAAMMDMVLEEMAGERAVPETDSANTAPEQVAPEQAASAVVAAPQPLAAPFDPAVVEAMLASRDAEIAELRQALERMAARDDDGQMDAALAERDIQLAGLQAAVESLALRDERAGFEPLLSERDARIAELNDAVVQLLTRDETATIEPLLAERDARLAEMQDAVAQLAARDDAATMRRMLAERDAEMAELQDAVSMLLARDPQAELQSVLAQRDAQIADLHHAVQNLSAQYAAAMAAQPDLSALQDRLARIESRAAEQERTMRQTLTMLIDWFDSDIEQSRAA